MVAEQCIVRQVFARLRVCVRPHVQQSGCRAVCCARLAATVASHVARVTCCPHVPGWLVQASHIFHVPIVVDLPLLFAFITFCCHHPKHGQSLQPCFVFPCGCEACVSVYQYAQVIRLWLSSSSVGGASGLNYLLRLHWMKWGAPAIV